MIVLQSESLHRPVEVDKESSPTTVYVRTNIEEREREDEGGKLTTYYAYTEAQFTKEEYRLHELEQLVADLAELTLEVLDNG